MNRKKILIFVSIKLVVVGLAVAAVFLLMPAAKAAPIETFQFDNSETEAAFHRLSDELRCLVCQNQNIAESNAELAKDLRLEMYTMLMEGKTEEQIVDFMVERYGDYVLYRPPMKPLTWLLWFGPLLLFAAGLVFVVHYLKSQNRSLQDEHLSVDDIERIKSLHAERQAGQTDKDQTG